MFYKHHSSYICVVVFQFYFDSPSKLLRNDNARPLTREDYLKYGNRPLSLIYDFKSSKLELHHANMSL